MENKDAKAGLLHIHDALAGLETSARKLSNQNFADIIKHARGRIAQAMEHPDLDTVGAQLRKDHGEKLERAKGSRTSGSGPFANPVTGDTTAFKPGDPKFGEHNPEFRHPNDAELNSDGTLKNAPNSFGHSDDRDKK